jgi:hypothetical protein
MHLFNLPEVMPEQAAKYLEEATGSDIYPSLPPEAKVLARNPQDLALLVDVFQHWQVACALRLYPRLSGIYRSVRRLSAERNSKAPRRH